MSDSNRLTPEETTTAVVDNKRPDNQQEDKTSSLYSCLVYCELAVSLVDKQNHIKRLQNLRKEVNFIKDTDWIISNWFNLEYYRDENDKKLELEEIEDYLDNEIKRDKPIGISFQDNLILPKQIENTQSDKNCFKKEGVITKLHSDDGIIDNVHLFNITDTCKDITDLTVGCTVEYLAYRPHGDDSNIKIKKILSIVSYSSDQELQNEIDQLKATHSEYFNTHEQNIPGYVKERCEHTINIFTDTDNWIKYTDVSLEFVPHNGDRVILNCTVQTDENYVNQIGETLECKSITPAFQKTIDGYVTKIDEEWSFGVINDNCYYMFAVLEIGCKPNIGDKITAEVIENERYSEFKWRCIKLKIVEKNSAQLLNNQIEIFNNKNGIEITENIKFTFKELSEHAIKEVIVKNCNTHRHKILRSILKINRANSQLTLLEPQMNDQIFIQPNESVIYKFRADAKFYGLRSEIFEIAFGGGFKIARKIEIDVGDVNNPNYKINNDHNINNNTTNLNGSYSSRRGANSYHRNAYNASQVWENIHHLNIVPGTKTNNTPKFVKVRFGQYEVPQRLKDAVLNSKNAKEIEENVERLFPCLSIDLNPDNYMQRLQTLLHIEEIEQFVQFRKYDQERAHFRKEGEYLRLDIENLAEKRPSLMVGDTIYAKCPFKTDNDNQQVYQAYIHKVLYNRILVKFNQNFHAEYNGSDYKLEFFFSRMVFRKQHYAIQKVQNHLGTEFLFPSKLILNDWPQIDVDLDNNMDLIMKNDNKILNWYNPLLNDIQKMAIKNILRGEAKKMPYVIFGPPGTGKTMTLIETILQIVKNCPGSRIIVGASSNSAADLIATRLIDSNGLQRGDFVRLVGQHLIERDLIADHLKPHCATIDIAIEGTRLDEMIVTESGLKLRCQKNHIGKHRITIGTCITLGTLIQLGFSKDHFTHIIIDEAGQCLESELMVALSQVDNQNGQIILAGDPLQLGPIVINNYACEKGLATSYLVRLLNRPPYMKDVDRYGAAGYNHLLITKLIYNYRSLPSILKSFNDLFYNSELKSCIDPIESREVKILQKITKHKIFSNCKNLSESHGIFFYDIRGQNRQDPDSPSWYNAEEATEIYRFVLSLYHLRIESNNIGIITPYQQQVKKIRNFFKATEDLRLPKIGSVEEFQGQERDIILISTVRSAKNLLPMDIKYTLGFVQSEKRMNVAISRARALLIIFGNSELLSLDSNWGKLINYCMETDSYITKN